MKAWVLGVALLSATGGGVAFVLASQANTPTEVTGQPAKVAGVCPSESTLGECSGCKSSPTDLADVSALLASAEPARPGVSFDEPPFAQPIRVRAQQPEVETAPMPRPVSATEEAPMPRPAM